MRRDDTQEIASTKDVSREASTWGNRPMSKATVLTDRFDRALLYATHVHGGQVRKGQPQFRTLLTCWQWLRQF